MTHAVSDAGDDLEHLTRALAVTASPPLGKPETMTRALERVRAAFEFPLADSPRAARALLAFRSSTTLAFVDLKYLCHALGRPNAWDGRRLLEDQALVERLLQQVETWRPELRRFRQCYRGLLESYRASAQAPGPGRQHLATYLERHRQAVATSQPPLAWTRGLMESPP